MKHITCDKCEMPSECEGSIRINNYKYDICQICINKILEGLKLKGSPIQNTPDYPFLVDKYKWPVNPNDHKFLSKDNV